MKQPLTATQRHRPGSESLRDAILRHAACSLVDLWDVLTLRERFHAVGLAVRDRLLDTAVETHARYLRADAKTVCYVSMEFLLGRLLGNNLINLGLRDECAKALRDLGQDLEELLDVEQDAALGNGGPGLLAACFLDSLATLGIPAWGFGLRYEYGLFKQEIRGGRQVERPNGWLTYGSPWLIERPEHACPVRLHGRVVNADRSGGFRPKWVEYDVVLGVPHDLPIVGYGGQTVNLLRLFSARAPQEFDLQALNETDFLDAIHRKLRCEAIHKVLYPNDHVADGPELRLVQEYFLAACSVHTLLRQCTQAGHEDCTQLPRKVAVHLNDTHAALLVVELLRVLLDEKHLPWETAWEVATATCAYTHYTLLPEALARWPVPLLERVLPRHLQIIYEINRRHLDHAETVFPGDGARRTRLSLIEEGPTKLVRMAHLAMVGSHAVNGVAAAHSELVKSQVAPDLCALAPRKFSNKTNGVSPRRWLLACNPDLAQLLTDAVGEGWGTELSRLGELKRFADDAGFRERFLAIRRANKRRLARSLWEENAVAIDPDALLAVQVKRMHPSKRPLLGALHVVYQYLQLVEEGRRPVVPRTYVFAGKAAPGCVAAKEIIFLLNSLADVLNDDPRTKGVLRVVFARHYRVTLAERLVPAADLSVQIATAGTEASGTSNLKFALNGALTAGTLDGVNVEIHDEVGAENFFHCGHTVEQVQALRSQGRHPRTFYESSPVARRLLDAFRDDRFSPGVPGRFNWVFRTLVEGWDPYFHLADLESYLEVQERVAREYSDRQAWAHKAVLTVARMGKFSSDRTVLEYARDIWQVAPVLP